MLTVGFYFVPPDNITLVWVANTLINFVRRADRATGLGDVRRHGRLLGVEIGPPRHRADLLGGLVRAEVGLGHRRRRRRLAAGVSSATRPTSRRAPRTVHGIVMMMSVIPAVAARSLAVAALWFYETRRGDGQQHVR